MKFSENWLRQHVKTRATREELATTLTSIGLEVEDMTVVGEALAGVVVARIVECAKHPEADRLQVCQVDTGNGLQQIVCGAPNARPGLLAPLATIGTKIGDITIKAAKLRGVESNGMLCSAKELGLDADASGLLELASDAPVGTPIATYLGLPDASIELKLTPNRADCFGVRGIAFDVAAATGTTVEPLQATAVPAQSTTTMTVELEAGAKVPRFAGRVIEGVNPKATTPVWMAERLRRSGVRPISFLVDVTQYVMLELGQPMHAFDKDSLQGPVVVRPAHAGESVKLLDGRTVALDGDFLVVSDSAGGKASRAVALGGIMGGFDTRVTDVTRNVFLEAAHWIPSAIIGRSRKLGMHTDAGHRFERGVDPQLPPQAIEYATRLILDVAGGTPGPLIDVVRQADLAQRAPVRLRRARLARVLGMRVEDADVSRILSALGMDVQNNDEGWTVTPPSRRFDIEIEEDLIEEVVRIHGYDRVPTRSPSGELKLALRPEAELPVPRLRAALTARGYCEAVCYSFVPRELLEIWHAQSDMVALANPLSTDLAVMRTALLPGLVEALKYNRNRQQERVRLFEIANVFAAGKDAPRETQRIAAVACGRALPEAWGTPEKREVDFADLKGDLEALLALRGHRSDIAFRQLDRADFHPGRSAEVWIGGQVAGVIGSLHPRLAKALDLEGDVVAFELDLAPVAGGSLPQAQELSKFPGVRRDIAVIVPEAMAWSRIEASVRGALGGSLHDLFVFDLYQGANLGSGVKSLAIGLILQDSYRTLTDQDADVFIASVVTALERDCQARLRG